MNDIILSRRADEHVPPNRWVASLSNGETIYEDERKGLRSTWERLAEYCMQNDLSITNLRLQMGAKEIKLPGGQEGYLQKKIAWTNFTVSGINKCIGYVQGGKAYMHIIENERMGRTVRTVDPGTPFVIYRKDVRYANSV